MVQSVKKCLRKSVGRSTLCFDQLNNLLVEIEAIVNSRPLTYVYSDSGISYALSSSHLLHGRRLTATNNSAHHEIVSTYNSLALRHKQQKHLFDQFLNIWQKNYLLNLHEHYSIKMRQNKKSIIAVGDVMVLKNDSTKRHFWRIAVAQQLLTGSDGVVRAAIVKVVDCEGKSSVLRQSIQHLVPIKAGTKSDTEEDTPIHVNSRSSEAPVSSSNDTTKNAPSRPRRHAAVVGESTVN